MTIDGLIGAFTSPHARNWHPLTTISHMIDCQVFGLSPTGPHLINVILHALTAPGSDRRPERLWNEHRLRRILAISKQNRETPPAPKRSIGVHSALRPIFSALT